MAACCARISWLVGMRRKLGYSSNQRLLIPFILRSTDEEHVTQAMVFFPPSSEALWRHYAHTCCVYLHNNPTSQHGTHLKHPTPPASPRPCHSIFKYDLTARRTFPNNPSHQHDAYVYTHSRHSTPPVSSGSLRRVVPVKPGK